jgi:hypothetical protein
VRTSSTASFVCGAAAWSAAWSTYHLAKNPSPPKSGNPSRASMKIAIATAYPGRTVQSPE